MTVWKELSKYTPKLNFVEVQEDRWDRGGTRPAGEYNFFTEKRMGPMN